MEAQELKGLILATELVFLSDCLDSFTFDPNCKTQALRITRNRFIYVSEIFNCKQLNSHIFLSFSSQINKKDAF